MNRCELTDLPIGQCVCHHQKATNAPSVVSRSSPPPVRGRWRPALKKRSGSQWSSGTPAGCGRVPVPMECDHPHDTGICDDCWAELKRLLQDVPAMVLELQAAIRRDTRFVQHGWVIDDESQPDDSGAGVRLDFNPAAARILTRLADGLRGACARGLVLIRRDALPLDRGQRAAFLASALSRLERTNVCNRDLLSWLSNEMHAAHLAIDRPVDWWYYGPCPTCNTAIWDERGIDHIGCPCGYAATLADHQAKSLKARRADRLTVSELVAVLKSAGRAVSRQTIYHLEARRGLPRDVARIPRWVNGRVEVDEVYVYRLGDVLDLLV